MGDRHCLLPCASMPGQMVGCLMATVVIGGGCFEDRSALLLSLSRPVLRESSRSRELAAPAPHIDVHCPPTYARGRPAVTISMVSSCAACNSRSKPPEQPAVGGSKSPSTTVADGCRARCFTGSPSAGAKQRTKSCSCCAAASSGRRVLRDATPGVHALLSTAGAVRGGVFVLMASDVLRWLLSPGLDP